MNRNKKIIYIMVVLLAVIAGWLYFENSSGKEVRATRIQSECSTLSSEAVYMMSA